MISPLNSLTTASAPRRPPAPVSVPADVFTPSPQTARLEVRKTGEAVTGALGAVGGGVIGLGLSQSLPFSLRLAVAATAALVFGGVGLHLGRSADEQRAIRGTLGLEMNDATPPTITKVHDNSLASLAGLKTGDTLLTVGPYELTVAGGIHDTHEDNNSVIRHPFENRLVDTLHDNLDGCYVLARRDGKTIGLHFPRIEME